MDSLRAIAIAHYNSGTKEVRALAHNFFNTLDTNRDGKVDKQEFLTFMRGEGYGTAVRNNIFGALDTNNTGALDFDQVMTLYYIIKSGMPYCATCGDLVTGVFFTCVACYRGRTFDLCYECYNNGGGTRHSHDGRSQFLDSYTMLFEMKNSSMKSKSANQNQGGGSRIDMSSEIEIFRRVEPQYQSSTSSTAIVLGSRSGKITNAFRAFELGLAMGKAGNALCTIL